MILYFSGTGSGKYVAKRIADAPGGEQRCNHDRPAAVSL